MFDVPPPEEGGLRTVVEIVSVVTRVIVLLATPLARKTLGLSIIACVTLGIWVDSVRKFVGVARFVAGNWMGVLGGAIVNGVMLVGGKTGAVLPTAAVP